MSAYIGPERRNGERRQLKAERFVERRVGPDRRQAALAGVIGNMTGEDMQRLANIWRYIEAERDRSNGREERQDLIDKWTDPPEEAVIE